MARGLVSRALDDPAQQADDYHGFFESGRGDDSMRRRIIGTDWPIDTSPVISSPRTVSSPLPGPSVCLKLNTSPEMVPSIDRGEVGRPAPANPIHSIKPLPWALLLEIPPHLGLNRSSRNVAACQCPVRHGHTSLWIHRRSRKPSRCQHSREENHPNGSHPCPFRFVKPGGAVSLPPEHQGAACTTLGHGDLPHHLVFRSPSSLLRRTYPSSKVNTSTHGALDLFPRDRASV